MKRFLFILFLLPVFCFSQENKQPQVSSSSYISAFFISPEDWVSKSSQTSLNNIVKFIEDAYNKNFHSVIFKVRQNGYVFYKSSIETLSPLFQKKSLDLDYLSIAISEAKKYNLKFFVLMEMLKTNSNGKVEWLCRKENNEIFKPYYYSAGIPQVQQYLREVIKEFIQLYPEVDGIILDDLIYPSKETSFDEISKYRFYTRGNPQLSEYEDFQRQQLNKLICDIYSEIKNLNKNIAVGVITESVYKNPKTLEGVYYNNFQDINLWVNNKWCDFIIVKSSYSKTYSFPESNFENNIIIGKVFDEIGQPLSDAWVYLYTKNKKITTLSSNDGLFSFINVSTETLNLEVFYPWCEKVVISSMSVSNNEIKFLEPIVIPNASYERKKLFFYIFKPENFLMPSYNTIHILGRTYPKYNVFTFRANNPILTKVFSTGIFALDDIKLKQGENNFRFIISYDKEISTYSFTILYSPKPQVETLKEEKDFEIIAPKEDLLLFTGDVLELKIKAQKNKKFYAVCFDNNQKIFLDEIEDGVYYKRFLIPENFSSKKTNLVFFYEEKIPKKFFLQRQKIKNVSSPTDYYVEVWNSAYPLIAETVSEKTPMTYGLHYVRLGGPYITELPKGIKLQVVGKKQDKYKVKLSSTFSGWVDQKDVVLKLNETKILQNYFTSITITTETEKDKIVIPWVERTPFSVSSSVEDNKLFLVVDFFNTHFATTWVINHLNTKVLDYPKISQIEDGHLRIVFPIKQKYLWGFWAEATKSKLVIYVNYPPKINKENVLKGIKIGIEAGHGGDDNIGALGVSGTKEKNINLTAAQVLKSVLEKEGAKVVFLREGDTNPDFSKRLATAYNSDVDLIISLHANSTDTERNGYLKNSGFSVYYKWDHCRILAEEIFKELKNLWNTTDGLIGNFNYAPIRQTRIPAVLIEQGYMTNPYDESKLLDKNFLYQESLLIKNALKKFFKKIIE